MTVIISGNDYVLYSVLKVSNIILHDVYSHSESNNRYFTSDLENKLKQTNVKTVNSLRTNIHNKDFSVSTFLYFTLAMFLLSHSIYTGHDKALQII